MPPLASRSQRGYLQPIRMLEQPPTPYSTTIARRDRVSEYVRDHLDNRTIS